jgi:hypothetical protein
MGSGYDTRWLVVQSMNGRREFNRWFDPEAVRVVMNTLEEDHYHTKRRLDKDIYASESRQERRRSIHRLRVIGASTPDPV